MSEPRQAPASELAVVYGTAIDPALAIAEERDALVAAGRWLSPRLALIAPDTPPLRLNSQGWANLSPQMAGDLAGPEEMLRFCRYTLERRTPLFVRPIRLFLANYLDFVEAEVERQRPALEAQMESSGLPAASDFPTYRDWLFSALLPMPNAHVAFVSKGDTIGAVEFAHVDILFWTGRETLAVVLQGLTMPTPSQIRRLAAVEAAQPNFRVIHIPASLAGERSIPEPLLEKLRGCWQGLALPFGLFRVPALSVKIANAVSVPLQMM